MHLCLYEYLCNIVIHCRKADQRMILKARFVHLKQQIIPFTTTLRDKTIIIVSIEG